MHFKRIFSLILFIIICSVSFSQDTVMIMSPSMYEDVEEIYPAKWQGWYFKQGNDTAWAAQKIDMKGWKKMRPVDLSVSLADANGKVEGWFRGIVKIDSSFGNTPFSLYFGLWAAQDIYIDGKKVAAAGNTGSNGKPYAEKRVSADNLIFLLSDFKAGTIHTVAWHIVDSRALPFNGNKLKSETRGLHNLLEITSPVFTEWRLVKIKFLAVVDSGINASLLLFGVLFWLLWSVNRKETNLLHFALFTTILGMHFIADSIFDSLYFSITPSFTFFQWKGVVYTILAFIIIGYIPYILALIFKHPLTKRLPLVIGLVIFIVSIVIFFNILYVVGIIIFFILLLLIIYVAVSSLKKASGGDWAILIGLLLTTLFSYLYFTFSKNAYNFTKYMPYKAGFALSFPLSLLIYVVIRFREMITDIQSNAQQIIVLSDEKRIQAEQQQELLEVQVKERTIELENSINNLKATQSQLIQSEKMASLGELTAGIAHEIQNPLNFVNNFSEVNKELLEELKAERLKPNAERQEALENELINDVISNEEKINHHGKRADAIVKGMLQHSRSSSGIKEPTDINALADEYLRLAYHGLRAKDKSFNATLITDFDDSIGMIDMIPQDMGRVILNLITNAFYVVDEKKKQIGGDYEPTVSVSTKKNNNKIEISVKDNGNGIPPKILEKIFQPFFTTKPTGQGTGLGLSLSYDIVKAHGGELKVETKETEGTTFIILLPA